jgi:hypothetical protein
MVTPIMSEEFVHVFRFFVKVFYFVSSSLSVLTTMELPGLDHDTWVYTLRLCDIKTLGRFGQVSVLRVLNRRCAHFADLVQASQAALAASRDDSIWESFLEVEFPDHAELLKVRGEADAFTTPWSKYALIVTEGSYAEKYGAIN